jgi:hypothetical protein
MFRTDNSFEDFTPLELTMDQNYLCPLKKQNESVGNVLWFQPYCKAVNNQLQQIRPI